MQKEKRTTSEIKDAVIKAIKDNGPLTRSEIDFHCDVERTAENHLPRLREDGVVHIAKWEIRRVPGRYEALFDVGSNPDAPRPRKKEPELPKPSEPGRRAIFFDEEEALADMKYKKQYRPEPKCIHVPWLGAF